MEGGQLGERVARVEERLRGLREHTDETIRELRADLRELEREVMGPSTNRRLSVRQRLHDLAGDVGKLLLRVDAIERRPAAETQAKREAWELRFTRRAKVAGLVLALWTVLIPTVNLFLNLR